MAIPEALGAYILKLKQEKRAGELQALMGMVSLQSNIMDLRSRNADRLNTQQAGAAMVKLAPDVQKSLATHTPLAPHDLSTLRPGAQAKLIEPYLGLTEKAQTGADTEAARQQAQANWDANFGNVVKQQDIAHTEESLGGGAVGASARKLLEGYANMSTLDQVAAIDQLYSIPGASLARTAIRNTPGLKPALNAWYGANSLKTGRHVAEDPGAYFAAGVQTGIASPETDKSWFAGPIVPTPAATGEWGAKTLTSNDASANALVTQPYFPMMPAPKMGVSGKGYMGKMPAGSVQGMKNMADHIAYDETQADATGNSAKMNTAALAFRAFRQAVDMGATATPETAGGSPVHVVNYMGQKFTYNDQEYQELSDYLDQLESGQ